MEKISKLNRAIKKTLRHISEGEFKPSRIVLFGGDRATAEAYRVEAKGRKLTVDYFDSVHAMGFLGRFREYDAAIVHEDLEPLTGLELAEYLDTFFSSLPMILLGDRDKSFGGLPSAVVEFFAKATDAATVLTRVEQSLRYAQLLVVQNK